MSFYPPPVDLPAVEDLSLPPPLSPKSSVKTTKQVSPKRGSKLASVGSFFKSFLTKKPPASDISLPDPDSQTIPAKTDNSNQSQNIDDIISLVKSMETKYSSLQKELNSLKSSGLKMEGQSPNNRIIEKTIEKIVSGLSQADLDSGLSNLRTELNNLNTNLLNQINNLSVQSNRQTSAVYQAVSLTNKIDSLTGTRLTNITVSGVSGLADSDIPDGITASNYLPLTGGTISGDLTVNGSATLGALTLQSATAGYFTATTTTASTFPYASTTALTVSGSAYIGSLNGPLQANNGLVSATTSVGSIYGGTGLDSSALTGLAQIVAGTWSASSTLSTAFGGTGWNSLQANSILLGNGAGRIATTSAGTDGYVLALSSGVPTWLATSTLSTITGTLAVGKGGTGIDSSALTGIAQIVAGTWSASSTLSVAFGGTGWGNIAAGYIPFGNGAAALATSSSFYWDNSNSKLGIGTTTPNSKLTVYNGSADSAIEFSSASGDTYKWTMGMDYSDGGKFKIASSTALGTIDRFTIDGNGNVGIGTTSPYAKLSVVGETVSSYFTATSTTATSTFAGGMSVAGTAGLTVLQNGNVGVGTTSPAGNLDVNGALYVQGIEIRRSSANGGANALEFYIYNDGTTLIDALTGDMLIRASGGNSVYFPNDNVGIGTTSPWSLLSLKGSSGAQMTIAQADTNYTQLTVDASGNLTLTPSGSTITIPDDNLKVCAGDACQTTALNSGNGNLTVENNIEIGGNYNRTCATGYVWVPGSAKFGTLPGFCAMKYEAKNDGSNNAVSTATGGPYVNTDQPTSRTKCEAVGLGYHLISEPEWMTIAENIAQTPINDLESTAGLQLATGHSDNAPASALASTAGADPIVTGCNLSAPLSSNTYSSTCQLRGTTGGGDNDKGYYDTGQTYTGSYTSGVASDSQLRTHVLSNGNVIWDIAGNVWEWTDAYIHTAELPAPSNGAWQEWTAITDYKTLNYARPQNPSWASANGIGQYIGTTGATRGYVRGGGWAHGAGAGVFTLHLHYAPSVTDTYLGFRCSR